MRIAIVDDIASERETLKERVAVQTARLSLDAAVSCYASGTDFLACAGKEHFDLVFLDIYIRNENGVDTAEHYQHQIYVYSATGDSLSTWNTRRILTARASS